MNESEAVEKLRMLRAEMGEWAHVVGERFVDWCAALDEAIKLLTEGEKP